MIKNHSAVKSMVHDIKVFMRKEIQSRDKPVTNKRELAVLSTYLIAFCHVLMEKLCDRYPDQPVEVVYPDEAERFISSLTDKVDLENDVSVVEHLESCRRG